MAQTSLDRRDRRRAHAISEQLHFASDHEHVAIIDAALKREREDAGFAAIGYLFAKSKQAAARKAFQAKHGGKR